MKHPGYSLHLEVTKIHSGIIRIFGDEKQTKENFLVTKKFSVDGNLHLCSSTAHQFQGRRIFTFDIPTRLAELF
jgi:hypothetical protein